MVSRISKAPGAALRQMGLVNYKSKPEEAIRLGIAACAAGTTRVGRRRTTTWPTRGRGVGESEPGCEDGVLAGVCDENLARRPEGQAGGAGQSCRERSGDDPPKLRVADHGGHGLRGDDDLANRVVVVVGDEEAT